jgi:hypothetical protein
VRAGGVEFDASGGIANVGDSTIAIGGFFEGEATFGPGDPNETVLNSAGGSGDVCVASYDLDGALIWATGAGGVGLDGANDIAALPDGSLFATGVFEDSAVFGEAEAEETTLVDGGDWDCFVARFESDGLLTWAVSAGGDAYASGQGIDVLDDETTLVVGAFEGTATFGQGEVNETTLVAVGTHDMFLARFDPAGELVWATQAEGLDFVTAWAVLVIEDGSAIVTGEFMDTATFGAGEPNETILDDGVGFYDLFIAKYDPDGQLVWAKQTEGDYEVSGRGVSALTDGSSLVTGFVWDTATFGPGELNETVLTTADGDSSDPFVAKYNPDGTLDWAVKADGSGGDFAVDIAALADGSSLVTGAFREGITFGPGEPNETYLVSMGADDGFIARYDPDGSLVWVEASGGPGMGGGGRSVTALSDGSPLVAGTFTDVVTFGLGESNETTLTAVGPSDQPDICIARFLP